MTTSRKPNRTRPKQIILWASVEEHRTLSEAARRAGLGLGPWLRMLGLHVARGQTLRDITGMTDVLRGAPRSSRRPYGEEKP